MSERPNPRKDPEAAYQAFMSMPESEWQGLLRSLLGGGVLEIAEQQGFERALKDRRVRSTGKMQLNPEPLKIVKLPTCRKCGRSWGLRGTCVCLDPDLDNE